jgi:hypothetical protein
MILISCAKQQKKGYNIENWASVELKLTTPEKSYSVKGGSTVLINSSGNFMEFQYVYDNLFARVDSKNEHPIKTVMVVAYKHKLSVHISGNSDSAYTVINSANYKVKLPYYWGSNNIHEYDVVVRPKDSKPIHTSIRVNDRKVDEFHHINGTEGRLSGYANY